MRRFIVLATWAALGGTAHAFCGFYVAGADTELFNNATNVVLMREGTTTVLSMQNDYQGPTEDFAMVVPVPVVLDESNVKTLPRDLFERIDALAAPRLVEYWEQDPCIERPFGEGTIGLGNLGTIGFGGGGGSGYGRGLRVQIEAEFTVGEYEIMILGAQDSNDLETWLRQNGYRIPEGASEALRPYVEGGMKFFVAKVDAGKVTFEDGRALLSPLRMHYDSETFSLPVRLGMLNSSGAQDLIVHVLSRNQRYEVANYENVTIPTNIDVQDSVRERFGEFYAALFDRVLERNPNSVVTEYAWQATNCDPCPGPVLSSNDLMTLGADVSTEEAPNAAARRISVPRIRTGEADVRGSLSKEVIRRVIRRHMNEVRFCYEQELNTRPDLEGRVTVRFVISPTGAVQASTVQSSTLSNQRVESCITTAVRRWTFPAPDGGGIVLVNYPFVLSATDAGPARSFGPSPLINFVLTRLHYRYGRGELGDDLVFRPAPPIVGGREIHGPTGRVETGATESVANNFQGRYVIRHPWEGAIDCAEPQRGHWGPRPLQLGGEAETLAATNTASATRGQLRLSDVLAEALPALGVASLTQPPVETPVETPAPTAEQPAPVASTSSGCGGCSTGNAAGSWMLVFLLVLARRRR